MTFSWACDKDVCKHNALETSPYLHDIDVFLNHMGVISPFLILLKSSSPRDCFIKLTWLNEFFKN